MASPSVTYTFANSTASDATQVNQNFTDLINALSDGTKDLSISAFTCAGTATLNGHVNLGNSSSDDLTITASLASTLAIKTTNSYDIGSSTLGLRSAYFGANSQTVAIKGSASMSATWTLTLPVTAGTSRYRLETDGAGVTSWQPVRRSGTDAQNVGLAASVATNALTIALKGADGNDPSSTNPVDIVFRSSTSATGTETNRTCTAAASLVISSGSTLGTVSAKAHWIYVYALDNSGTIELAASLSRFDDGSIQSTTAEGGTGTADSDNLIYSTTARASVPIRLIGRIRSTQTVAGTWATTPSEVSVGAFTSGPYSEVFVTGGNGHGSTNTKIRRFVTTVVSRGKDITYADSGTNGGSFTINSDGIYAMTYTDISSSGAPHVGISLNSAELTTVVQSITNADRLLQVIPPQDRTGVACLTTRLRSGDVVRAHTDATTDATLDAQVNFRITKVSDA